MKSALIENDVIMNIIEGTLDGYIEIPDGFDIGDTYDGENFIKAEVVLTLEETETKVMNEIYSLFLSEIQTIKSNYLPDEILSWEQQRTEAIAWTADNGAVVPLITGLAAAREMSLSELVAKINTNVAAYETVYSAALGKKQKHKDSVTAITGSEDTDQEKIDALNALNII